MFATFILISFILYLGGNLRQRRFGTMVGELLFTGVQSLFVPFVVTLPTVVFLPGITLIYIGLSSSYRKNDG